MVRDSIEAQRCDECGIEYYLSPEVGVCVECSLDSMEMLSPVVLRVMSNLVERATAAGCPPNEENAEILRSHGINVPREGQEGE